MWESIVEVSHFGVILGWALGALTALVATVRVERKRGAEFRTVLFAELRELRLRLVGVVWQHRAETIREIRENSNWALRVYESYRGGHPTEPIVSQMRKLANATDRELEPLLAALEASPIESRLSPEYDAPFLRSNLERLSVLEEEQQIRCLELLAQLGNFNYFVRRAAMYHDRTFEPEALDGNRAIIAENYRQAAHRATRLARSIADRISAVLDTETGSQ